jgi:spore maturation protein CgeB
MTAGSSATTRMWALRRAGHEVTVVDPDAYWAKNKYVHKVMFRLMAGPWVNWLNRELLRLAEELKPDVFWADKVLALQPKTLKKLRAMGITTVSYMIDNPFGPRRDPGWGLYMKCIPLWDLHCTQRDVSVTAYKERGARDVIKIQTAYDREAHFPAAVGWTDKDRDREVSFIGTPYDNRAEFLAQLSDAGMPVVISGSTRAWQRALSPEQFEKMHREGELFDEAYRKGVWRSKINISFLTKSNQDEFTQKSFEIAGCGGFLLVERSEGHRERFVEDEEAVFFSDLEECIAKIERYLPDEAARTRIAAAGMERAERDGYHNDHQIKLIVERLETIRNTCRQQVGA